MKSPQFDVADSSLLLNYSKKRLPRLDAGPRPRWAGKYLRWDQLFLLYTLANWCKDDNGDVLSADYAYKVAEHGLFEGVKSTNSIFMILKLPKRAVTSALAEAMGDEEIALFYMNKADAMHRKYIAEERFAESRIDIPMLVGLHSIDDEIRCLRDQ